MEEICRAGGSFGVQANFDLLFEVPYILGDFGASLGTFHICIYTNFSCNLTNFSILSSPSNKGLVGSQFSPQIGRNFGG